MQKRKDRPLRRRQALTPGVLPRMAFKSKPIFAKPDIKRWFSGSLIPSKIVAAIGNISLGILISTGVNRYTVKSKSEGKQVSALIQPRRCLRSLLPL